MKRSAAEEINVGVVNTFSNITSFRKSGETLLEEIGRLKGVH